MTGLLTELRFSLFLIIHPLRGFWELKAEKKGSLRAMAVILSVFIAVQIVSRQFTAYIFNDSYFTGFNVFTLMAQTLAIFLIYCVANWCLTSLFDGEGSFKDICIASSYALVPMILIDLPMVLVSHALAGRETVFYTFFLTLGMAWTGLLIVFSTMVTHQYEFGKTLLIMVFILLGMCVIVFIAMLFWNIIGQMVGFATNIYKEIAYRA